MSADIIRKLSDACVGSCNCHAKVPDFDNHAERCRFRVLIEAIDRIADQSATIANLSKVVANDLMSLEELRLQIRDAQEDAANYRTSAEAEIAELRKQLTAMRSALRWHIDVYLDHFGRPTNPDHPVHKHAALAGAEHTP